MKKSTKSQKDKKIVRNEIKKILKKLLIMIIIFIFNILNVINVCNAGADFGKYNLEALIDCGELIKYNGKTVKTYYTLYNGKLFSFPVYCLNENKPGVTPEFTYGVNAEKFIEDIVLWRYITNGYPYKTEKELGCINVEEAYTATEQAIYCYLHNKNIELYEPIGEAGERVIKAIKQIINSARESTEKHEKYTVELNSSQKNFTEDSIDNKYVSKTYEVASNAKVLSYLVLIERRKPEQAEILITDINNKPGNILKGGQKFKILIPKKDLPEKGELQVKVKAELETKDILYGKPENEEYQDYAVTTSRSENYYKSIEEIYSDDQASLKIIKQDQETKERIEGVEFNILDNEKQIKYENIKTDIKGEYTINNIEPGEYYLVETKTKEGYKINSEPLKIIIGLNEEKIVTINNLKEDRAKETVEIKEVKKQVKKGENKEQEEPIQVKKLPVTGM